MYVVCVCSKMIVGTTCSKYCIHWFLHMLQGVTPIIYAWGDSDPVGAASFHKSQRGTQGIALLPSDEIAADLDESESFLLTVKNVSIW